MFNICSIEGKVELDMCPVKIRELRKYLCFVRVFAKVQIIGNFDHWMRIFVLTFENSKFRNQNMLFGTFEKSKNSKTKNTCFLDDWKVECSKVQTFGTLKAVRTFESSKKNRLFGRTVGAFEKDVFVFFRCWNLKMPCLLHLSKINNLKTQTLLNVWICWIFDFVKEWNLFLNEFFVVNVSNHWVLVFDDIAK